MSKLQETETKTNTNVKINTEKETFVKKGDIVLILVLVFVAALLALFFSLQGKQGKETGEMVLVTIDGAVYGEYSLYEDTEMTLQSEWGENRFEIKGGIVKMLAADCPDKYCVKHGAMKTEKDPIVCLPHRVVIEIVSD